jgi:hypothetical protein
MIPDENLQLLLTGSHTGTGTKSDWQPYAWEIPEPASNGARFKTSGYFS